MKIKFLFLLALPLLAAACSLNTQTNESTKQSINNSTKNNQTTMDTSNTAVKSAPQDWKTYSDLNGKFTIQYPTAYEPREFSNYKNIFGVAASFAFEGLSYDELHQAEVVLTDKAIFTNYSLGFGYDPNTFRLNITLFPDNFLEKYFSLITKPNADSFCDLLSKQSHFDKVYFDTNFPELNDKQKNALLSIDQTGNIDPKIIVCKKNKNTIVFHKEVTYDKDIKTRQNIYGAIRFLQAPYYSIQYISVSENTPTSEQLEIAENIVNSFESK